MPTSEIVSILTAVTGIVAVVLAFVPRLWERYKTQAEARTIGAQETKTKAEAADILVDTTMALAARLDEQILSLMSERDALKRERDTMRADYDAQFLSLHTEMARAQEQLAIMSSQFEECKRGLDGRMASIEDLTGELARYEKRTHEFLSVLRLLKTRMPDAFASVDLPSEAEEAAWILSDKPLLKE